MSLFLIGRFIVESTAPARLFRIQKEAQYDPCYHLACDTFDNISLEELDQNSDAADNAVANHVAKHEDLVGTCLENCEAACDDEDFCTQDYELHLPVGAPRSPPSFPPFGCRRGPRGAATLEP